MKNIIAVLCVFASAAASTRCADEHGTKRGETQGAAPDAPSSSNDEPDQNGIGFGPSRAEPEPAPKLANQSLAAAAPVLVPAFVGAQGYGAVSKGGRGGKVIAVTNLNDSGPGSLRAALTDPNPRTVIFKVGGVVTLNSLISITSPYLTVAGQTAPGGGITVRFPPNQEPGVRGAGGDLIQIFTHDVVIRYLRLRRGNTGVHGDNINILDGSSNIILDHLSLEWATDENINIFSNEGGPVRNVTVQRSIIAEALNESLQTATGTKPGHPVGVIIAGHQPTDSWRKVERIDMLRNLFAHNTHRNPRVAAKGVRIVNNTIYNWHARAAETLKDAVIDWEANYFQHGPLSTNTIMYHESTNDTRTETYANASIYIQGNVAPKIAAFADPKADNWPMITDHYLPGHPLLPQAMRRLTRWTPAEAVPFPDRPIEALRARNQSLADAGANRRINCDGSVSITRDAVDTRIVNDIRNNTGPATKAELFATSTEAGGYTTEVTTSSCADSDADGMPDQWEAKHGLSSTSATDGVTDSDRDGYTNLEEYLNATNPKLAGR